MYVYIYIYIYAGPQKPGEVEIDILPIENNSKKKKVAKKI